MNAWTLGIGAVALLVILYLVSTRNQTSEGELQPVSRRLGSGGYKNTQTFELSNFDYDTFMPRRITVHREVTPL